MTGATIGIVAGSGPDAGIDLWNKVVEATRGLLGDAYSGDLDAPRVVVVSEPRLGLSMSLEDHEAEVWAALEATVRQLAPQVDHYAIACNTLHHFGPDVRALDVDAELVSVVDVTRSYVREQGLDVVGLLGARQVVELGDWSPYRPLADDVEVVTTARPDELHELIHAVKNYGADHPGLDGRWASIVSDVDAPVVLLVCTELPLLGPPATDKHLVDVTELLAEELAPEGYWQNVNQRHSSSISAM